MAHSQVSGGNLGQLAEVDIGLHEHCRSLPGSGGAAHRWATDWEQRCCLHDCKKDQGRRQTAHDWSMCNDARRSDAGWTNLAARIDVHDSRRVMAEGASLWSRCIAWCCLVVVAVEAGNCATKPHRLVAYEVQN